MDKASVRKEVKLRLNVVSSDELAARSRLICEQIINVIRLNNPCSVLSYMALNKEVNVSAVNEYCLNHGIELYLPRVNGDIIETVKYGDTTVGAFNVQEPVGQAVAINADVIIVPVAAVTEKLDRLGKGKGYYDRYLKGKAGLKIAAAFYEQVYDELPTEEHDERMDMVITG